MTEKSNQINVLNGRTKRTRTADPHHVKVVTKSIQPIDLHTYFAVLFTQKPQKTHIFDGFKSTSYKTKTTVFTHFLHSVLLMILMAPIAAKADSLYLVGYTQHFIDFPSSAHTNSREWVTNNNLIAYESGGIGVGYFLNSFGQDSYFIAKKMSLFKNGWLDVSGNGGAVWGYRGCAANDDDPKTRLCPNVNIEVAFGQYQLQPVIILQMKSVTFTTKWVF